MPRRRSAGRREGGHESWEVALDYFGGDKAKAAMFVEVFGKAEVANTEAHRIADQHFDGNLPVAARFLHASASLTRRAGIDQSSEAPLGQTDRSIRKEGDSLQDSTEGHSRQDIHAEAASAEASEDETAGDATRLEKLGSTHQDSSSFSLPSVASNRKDDTQARISIEDLRRMENVSVMGKHGRPVRLLSARRPRSFTHEIFKAAGLNYHRGQPVFSKPIPEFQRSLTSVPGKRPSQRTRGEWPVTPTNTHHEMQSLPPRAQTSMGLSRQSEAAGTPQRSQTSLGSSRRRLESSSRHRQLRPVSEPPSIPCMLKRVTDDQDKIRIHLHKPWWDSFNSQSMEKERQRARHVGPEALTICLPKLCTVPGSATASIDEIPGITQRGQLTLEADTAAYADIMAEYPVRHDSEARDVKERVILLLRDRFGIDLHNADIPVRCVTESVLTKAALDQKRSLNAHLLDVHVQVVAIKGEQLMPKTLSKRMHALDDDDDDDDSKSRGRLKSTPLERSKSTPLERSAVKRTVVEILFVRGLHKHQLAAEIAKEVGLAFLFVNDFRGLNSRTEVGFSELCRYLWVKSEKEGVEEADAVAANELQELHRQLEEVQAELAEVRKAADSAHKERAEADEAELVAKKKLAAAKDAQLYGWPGAARKMDAARAAEVEARRELEEALEAEALVIGEQLPSTEARERDLQQRMRQREEERRLNAQLATAFSVYLAALENNPHPLKGDAFRQALLGLSSIEGDMAAFLEHLRQHKKFVEPRQKTVEERMREEEEELRLVNERQEAELKERYDRMEHAVKQMISRLEHAAPGAPGPPADLLHPEPVVRVHAEPADTYEAQVMDDLQDRIMLVEKGKLSAHELAEFCALQIHNSHDAVYNYKAGMTTFQQAKDFRAEGDLEQAKRALDKAKSAFNHAGAEGESKLHELARIEKLVVREQKQLQMAISFHKQAEAAAASGALELFRKHWTEARSLYQSCGASSHKPDLLEALEELDRLVRGQEVELKATNEALATVSAAFEQRDMDTAARHISVAMAAMSKAGAAGKLRAEAAGALQASVVDTLRQIAHSAEQGARAALDADDLEGAEVCIAETWRASRLSAIALGKVSPDAEEKKLEEAERRQAKQQQSMVVSFSNEVAGTRAQGKAFSVMENLTLTSWPAREAEVAGHIEKCRSALQHLSEARGLLEEAGNEESKHKILALQKVELDLAIRLGANDKVAELLTKSHEDAAGSMEGGLPFVCLAAAADNLDGLDLLISRGAEVNAACKKGNTPVHHAVLSRAHKALRKLSEYRRCNPNKKNLQDRTPLHETVTPHREVPVGARIKAVWKSSHALAMSSAISEAAAVDAQHRHLEALTILLKSFPKLNPNLVSGPLAQTPLHLAAETGNKQALVELLQHPKVEANACDKRGRTPLMAGVWRMKSVQELLNSDKVDVNIRLQEKGWSACHVCIVKNNMTALEELLANPRVDLALEDNMGWTPIHLAMHEKSLRGVEKLLQCPAMDQHGFKVCQMLRTANALRHRGDPSSTGIWDQATPDILERLPTLLLGCRQWEFLHDVLCSIAFLSAIISNFGVDKAVDLFEATVMAVKQWSGIRPAIVSELERYKMALQTRTRDLREGKMEFSLVAFDYTLWGVKAMKIAVEQVVESVIGMGHMARAPELAHSKHMAITSKFFKVYNPLKRIGSNGLLRLVHNSSELPEASKAIKKIFINRDDRYIKQEISRVLQEEESENFTEQSHQRAIGQLASLLEVFGARSNFQTIKVVLDQPIGMCDVQDVRSRLCVAFHQVVEQYDNVHMRALRTYGHLDKTIVIIEVTNSPFHSAFSKDEEVIEAVIRRIIDKFDHEDDSRIQKYKEESKIESITRGAPSVFVSVEILCPQKLVRRFRTQQEFEAQILTDVRYCCNAKPHLLRVARTSCTWNSIIVEFLNDHAWTKSDRNFQQANRVVEEAGIPGSNLRKGVLTAHIVAARCMRSTLPPLMNGEWKHSNLHIAGLEADMHNEKKFLERYVLPAVQVIGVDKRCYFNWKQWSADHEPAKVAAQLKTCSCAVITDDREAELGFNFVVAILGHRQKHRKQPIESMDDSRPPSAATGEQSTSAGAPVAAQEQPAPPTEAPADAGDAASTPQPNEETVSAPRPSIAELVIQQSFLAKPYSTNSYVFLSDPGYLTNLDQSALIKCMTDEDGSQSRQQMVQMREKCLAESSSRCCHYSPQLVGVKHDLEFVRSTLHEKFEQLKRLQESLQKVEACAAKDQSYETRKLVYKRAVHQSRSEAVRWRRMLKEETEARGDAPDPILEDPVLTKLASQKGEDAADIDDIQARGVNLDVSWGMFQVGLAITDTLFAQLEGIGSAPPFHSHLSSREQQQRLREQTSARFVSCHGEPRTELLQSLLQAMCLPPRDRVPIVVLGGSKNSGRSTLLAHAASAVTGMPPGKSVPDMMVYHGRSGASFPSFLRHLCLEIALQTKGGAGLDMVPGSRATEECLSMLHAEILKAFQLDLTMLLVLDHLEEAEQVMIMKVVLDCHEMCKSAKYAAIQCVLNSDNPDKLGKAAQAAGLLDNPKDESIVKVQRIKGLSKAEQAALFLSFKRRFSASDMVEEEVRFLAAKQDADNPLYLLLFAHAKFLRSLQGRKLSLENIPSTLAMMWKHLVLPNMAEACGTVPEVIETALRILTAHPAGLSLSTFLSSIQEADDSKLGLSQVQLIVDSLEPLLRPATEYNEIVALAHPQILTAQTDDSATARGNQALDEAALLPLMFGMNMEDEHENSLSPYIVQEITALRWHFHDLFFARFVMPMVVASGLSGIEDVQEGTFGEERAKVKKSIFQLRDPKARIRSLSDLMKFGKLASSHVSLILNLVHEWNEKLQDLVASSPVRKVPEKKTESSFSNYYTFREKVVSVMKEMDDDFFQVPLTVLQGITFTEIALQPWLRDSVKVTSAEVAASLAQTMSEHQDEGYSGLALEWQTFEDLTAALQRDRPLVEAECARLEAQLVVEQRAMLGREDSTPNLLAQLLQDRIIDVVIEFRSWLEFRVRQAKDVSEKALSAEWREVSQKYIRAHCEDLEMSLADCVEHVKRVSRHVAARKFEEALEALNSHLENEEIEGAWEQYRRAQMCGHASTEEADASADASIGPALRLLASYETRLKKADTLLSTAAKNCVAFGPGLEGGKCGLPTVVKIRARNFLSNNQKKGEGTERWSVRVSCGKTVMPVDVCDNEDGTYDCNFVPAKPGTYSIDISFVERNSAEAVPLNGSPWQVVYEENIPWSAAHVSGIPPQIDARTHVAAAGERVVVIETVMGEVHVMQPEENGGWRCESAKLVGDLMQVNSIKGVQTLADSQLLCLCDPDSNRQLDSAGLDEQQAEDFAFFLLEVKAINAIRVQRIRLSTRISIPSEYRRQPAALWDWEDKVAQQEMSREELAELDMLGGQEDVASRGALVAVDQVELSSLLSEGGETAASLSRSSQSSDKFKSLSSDGFPTIARDSSDERYKLLSMHTFMERRGLQRKDPRVRHTTSRYIDFSVSPVVATSNNLARAHDGVSMLMLNFFPDAGVWMLRMSDLSIDRGLIVFGGCDAEDFIIATVHDEPGAAEGMPVVRKPLQEEEISWSSFEPSGDIPCVRSHFSLGRSQDMALLHGGRDEHGKTLNDVYVLDLSTHVWRSVLVMARPSKVTASYAFCPGLIAGVITDKPPRVHVLDYTKLIRGSKIPRCQQSAADHLNKMAMFLDETQKEIQSSDPQAVKHAVYNAKIHPQIDTGVQEFKELCTFLEKEGEQVQQLQADFDAFKFKLSRLDKLASDVKIKLQRDVKYNQLRPESSDVVKNIVLFSNLAIANNPAHTVFEVGHDKAMESIHTVLRKLKEKREQCLLEEQVELFFGQVDALASAKQNLDHQKSLLEKMARMWDVIRDLTQEAMMTFEDPRATDVQHFKSWKQHLEEEIICEDQELLETDVACEAEHLVENAIHASEWLSRFHLKETKDVMALTRVIYSLTGHILSPPTFMSLVQSEVIHDDSVHKLCLDMGGDTEDTPKVNLRDICVKANPKLLEAPQPTTSSMYSDSCFCEVTSATLRTRKTKRLKLSRSENTEGEETAITQILTISFSQFGQRPGSSMKEVEQCLVRCGLHSSFGCFVPAKILCKPAAEARQVASPGSDKGALMRPTLEGHIRIHVGAQKGPFIFSFGPEYTDVLLVPPDADKDQGQGNTLQLSVQCVPMLQSTWEHVLHYSRSELLAELASMQRHKRDLEAAAQRSADEELQRCSLAEEQSSVLRDCMGRPVVVDGCVRGAGPYAFFTPHVWDEVGRLVVEDGLGRIFKHGGNVASPSAQIASSLQPQQPAPAPAAAAAPQATQHEESAEEGVAGATNAAPATESTAENSEAQHMATGEPATAADTTPSFSIARKPSRVSFRVEDDLDQPAAHEGKEAAPRAAVDTEPELHTGS